MAQTIHGVPAVLVDQRGQPVSDGPPSASLVALVDQRGPHVVVAHPRYQASSDSMLG
jgi:hypothetical protein